MEGRRVRATVVSRNSEKELLLVLGLFRCLYEDIKVPVILERVGVDDVILSLISAALCVFFDEIFVGKTALWKLVKEFHVCWRSN